MWLSGGFSRDGTKIYRFTSSDGVDWAIANGGNPVLVPGDKDAGDFDWLGVETPVVIKAGEIFHMYYSAHKDGQYPFLTTGHAVSVDGDHWQKLGELVSITEVVGNNAGNPWGWLARGEPAAAYIDGTFLLYFTDVKCRQSDCAIAQDTRRPFAESVSLPPMMVTIFNRWDRNRSCCPTKGIIRPLTGGKDLRHRVWCRLTGNSSFMSLISGLSATNRFIGVFRGS
jgi:hypothetical protein